MQEISKEKILVQRKYTCFEATCLAVFFFISGGLQFYFASIASAAASVKKVNPYFAVD